MTVRLFHICHFIRKRPKTSGQLFIILIIIYLKKGISEILNFTKTISKREVQQLIKNQYNSKFSKIFL